MENKGRGGTCARLIDNSCLYTLAKTLLSLLLITAATMPFKHGLDIFWSQYGSV